MWIIKQLKDEKSDTHTNGGEDGKKEDSKVVIHTRQALNARI